jgi:hypothetical protein
MQVADEYGLTGDGRKLLFVIRIVENGGPGKEMGVLTPAAQRYAGNHTKSLRLQAQWAAGTIKKRYRGGLKEFANRYCPAVSDPVGHKNWIKNATAYMAQNTVDFKLE